MPLPKIKENIGELNKDVRSYINAKYDYMELRLLKKISTLFTRLLKIVLLCLLAVVVGTLLSFAASFWIGGQIDSYGGGFLIVAGFYFLIMLIILIFGKLIFRSTIIRKFSREITHMKKVIAEIIKS